MPEDFYFIIRDKSTDEVKAPTLLLRPASEQSGEKDVKYECDPMGSGQNPGAFFKCVLSKSETPEIIYGKYSVVSIIGTNGNYVDVTSATSNEFSLSEGVEVAPESEQTASQIIEGSKTSFTIKLKNTKGIPTLYPGNVEGTEPFSSCKLSDDNLSVICTPKSSEMNNDVETSIYYKDICNDELVDTGVKVTYRGTSDENPENSDSKTDSDTKTDNSSVFAVLSKITLLLGLLVLWIWINDHK